MSSPLYKAAGNAVDKSKMLNKFSTKFGGFGKLNKLSEAFAKTGGTVLNSSWILGYKIIEQPTSNPLSRLMMISFRNQKKPVFVITNDKDITSFSMLSHLVSSILRLEPLHVMVLRVVVLLQL